MTPPDSKALAERLEHEAMTLDAECRIMAKHSTSTNTPTRRAALYREAAAALTREPSTPSAQADDWRDKARDELIEWAETEGYIPPPSKLPTTWRERATGGYMTGDPVIDARTEAGAGAYATCADELERSLATPSAQAGEVVRYVRWHPKHGFNWRDTHDEPIGDIDTGWSDVALYATPSGQVSGGGEVEVSDLRDLLNEVRCCFTRDDDLPDDLLPRIDAVLSTPQARPDGVTYSSKQATECAGCGQRKHTPLRIDAMGGYVCLTCIDKKLGSLLGEFGYEQARPDGGADKLVLSKDLHSVYGNTNKAVTDQLWSLGYRKHPTPAPTPTADVYALDEISWIIRQLDAPERAAYSRYRGIEAIKHVATRLQDRMEMAVPTPAPDAVARLVEAGVLKEHWHMCCHPAWPDPLPCYGGRADAIRTIKRYPHPDAWLLRTVSGGRVEYRGDALVDLLTAAQQESQ